jgi:hemolysin III
MKPRLRGVSHEIAFFVSLATGAGLLATASGARARVAVAIYVASLCGLFGVSAIYHRHDWTSAAARQWMRRLDHSMIFIFIAGTCTPVALLALHGTLSVVLLSTVWGGAAAGIALKLIWVDAPKWLSAAVYVLLGWIGVVAIGQLGAVVGVAGIVVLGLGGLLYTAGAVVYATRKPDPIPSVFGYHEVFHALVIVAAGLHFGVIAVGIVPTG